MRSEWDDHNTILSLDLISRPPNAEPRAASHDLALFEPVYLNEYF